MAVRPRRRVKTKGAGSTAPDTSKKGGFVKRRSIPVIVEPDIPEFKGEVGNIINKLTESGRYGQPFIMGSSSRMVSERSRTGVLSLDLCLGGGWTVSRAGMLYGEKSCLAGSTFIAYQVIKSDGKVCNTKGGTIEQLFNRFHGNPKGKGAYIRPGMEDCHFTAPSLTDIGTISHNIVEDVWETGVQECFLVTTKNGHSIRATGKHRFYTGAAYVRLELLSVGNTVFVHNNTYRLKPDEDRYSNASRVYVNVKSHPVAGIKIVSGYRYHRLARARAVYEAYLNGIDYFNYIERLNAGVIGGLIFLGSDQHVHHKDNDHTNDAIENLQLLTSKEHGVLHGATRPGVIFEAVADNIASIESVGELPTYDIQMRDPYNNFVANKFVVHNSGKSTIAMQSIATMQKNDPDAIAAWVDVEGTFDPPWAHKFGVDLDRVAVIEPETGEHAVDLADAMVRAREIGMVITDSIAMIIPMREIEDSAEQDTMGGNSRLIGKYIRKTTNALMRERARGHKPVLIHINQFRMKVGLVFGDPRTLPGGKALEFSTTQQVEAKNKEILGKDSDGNNVVVYNEHNVKITKNKGGGPMKEGAYKLIRLEGHEGLPEAWIDQAKTIYKFGHQAGVVTGAAQSFEVDGVGGKFRGAPAFNAWAIENPLAYDRVQAKIIAAFRKRWALSD